MLQTIKNENARKNGHFFEPATMRFFKSRVCAQVFEGVGGVFFVTSESQATSGMRYYTVRSFDPLSGSVSTVGEFQQYGTRAKALKVAKAASLTCEEPAMQCGACARFGTNSSAMGHSPDCEKRV
jgi:hypothetical protein